MTTTIEEARKMAADAAAAYRGQKDNDWSGRIRRGQCDDGALVQAFLAAIELGERREREPKP